MIGCVSLFKGMGCPVKIHLMGHGDTPVPSLTTYMNTYRRASMKPTEQNAEKDFIQQSADMITRLTWHEEETLESVTVIPSPKSKNRFIKSIPLEWATTAANLPGKTLQVALAIWYRSGLNKGLPFQLSARTLREFGVGRQAGYHGIDALERAGLIEVKRRCGKHPVIAVIIRKSTD